MGMDALKKKRAVVRGAFTRLFIGLEERRKISGEGDPQVEVEMMSDLELLQEKYQHLASMDAEILDLLLQDPATKSQDLDMEVQMADEYSACMNVTYEPYDFALVGSFFMDEEMMFTRNISGKNPPPLCFPVVVVPLPILDFCVRFYNIFTPGANLHFCIDFEARIQRAPIAIIHFDCLRMGWDGLALVKPEDNGGLISMTESENTTQEETPSSSTTRPGDEAIQVTSSSGSDEEVTLDKEPAVSSSRPGGQEVVQNEESTTSITKPGVEDIHNKEPSTSTTRSGDEIYDLVAPGKNEIDTQNASTNNTST